MKYLKLYEQFDDDWDPFGEESDITGDIKVGDKVMILKGFYGGYVGTIVKIYKEEKNYFISIGHDIGTRIATFKENEFRKLSQEELKYLPGI